MSLTGFRDPFIIQKGGGGAKWRLILGSGIKGKGGTILLYESDDVRTGAAPCAVSHPQVQALMVVQTLTAMSQLAGSSL